MPVKKRSQARRLALQALCVFEGVGETFAEQLDDFIRKAGADPGLKTGHGLPPDYLEFARSLAQGVWDARQRYDRLIEETASDWTVERMPPVDRNVLRLGVHELFEHRETAPRIVINEAIELARRFGDADSPAFVNGVLDSIREKLENPPADAPPPEPAKENDGPA